MSDCSIKVIIVIKRNNSMNFFKNVAMKNQLYKYVTMLKIVTAT